MPRNRCEGLPDQPCPGNANFNSLKLCQGDLLLCPQCDAFRFGTVQTSKKSSRNTTLKPKLGPANSDESTDHINKPQSAHASVMATNQIGDDKCSWTNTDKQNEILHLKAEFIRLSDMVNNLSTKLSFVLSYLQFSDDTTSVLMLASETAGTWLPTTMNATKRNDDTQLLLELV
jgi:hypothetical protein